MKHTRAKKITKSKSKVAITLKISLCVIGLVFWMGFAAVLANSSDLGTALLEVDRKLLGSLAIYADHLFEIVIIMSLGLIRWLAGRFEK